MKRRILLSEITSLLLLRLLLTKLHDLTWRWDSKHTLENWFDQLGAKVRQMMALGFDQKILVGQKPWWL